ncbi:hypothetical protein PPO43_03845 [Saprospira sp. CCB-QB6]|uniref:hypothetical protein n=1 Tax=Saprospira sp. CCB-QB6 TaxID=3023936 RepID=UPI00234A3DC0|nr:hypothetical protein [Saprospira sp. CCB-QB6]WCL82234.1 hypothetical protein PPO43_03845 [Saprospira sp. CCB-QB6]
MANFDAFPPHSRVWIYQGQRPFTQEEQSEWNPKLQAFANSWLSHQRQLKAWGGILHNYFVVLMVDEDQADASGCSIDKSVAFMKEMGQATGQDLFERMFFLYRNEAGQIEGLPSTDFAQAFAEGKIKSDSPVFNNLVQTKAELESKWELPLEESWHKNFV